MDDNYKQHIAQKGIRFKPNLIREKKESWSWVVAILVSSFIFSIILSGVSSKILEKANIYVAGFVVIIIICISIIFDIIGIAVTAADKMPFHSMASRKVYGAKQAIKLIKNADRVSGFCNDVIGDICGIISGTASAYIIIRVVGHLGDVENTLTGLLITGVVGMLTVGGKAAGKHIAIENCNLIIYKLSVVLSFFNDWVKIFRIKLIIKPDRCANKKVR